VELKELRALQAIAEAGSFSLAARKLFLTQSALSHQIKNLEEELGETLLIRGKRSVTTSPAGRIVLASAEQILAEVNAIKERFETWSADRAQGSLRIAASYFGMGWIYGDLCEAFMARFPGLDITFRATETSEEAAHRVEEGAADVALMAFIDEHPLLDTIMLGTTEDVFIVGSSHPLQKRRTVSLEQVRQWPFIRFLPGNGTRATADRLFLSTGGFPPIATESNDMQFVKRVVGMGKAVALIPVVAVAQEARERRLRLLRLPDRILAVDFGLAFRRGVKMKTIELLKSFSLQMRGPKLRHLRIESLNTPAFATRAR
jgi:DNA-binding transcriptional LysR family regulator